LGEARNEKIGWRAERHPRAGQVAALYILGLLWFERETCYLVATLENVAFPLLLPLGEEMRTQAVLAETSLPRSGLLARDNFRNSASYGS